MTTRCSEISRLGSIWLVMMSCQKLVATAAGEGMVLALSRCADATACQAHKISAGTIRRRNNAAGMSRMRADAAGRTETEADMRNSNAGNSPNTLLHM